GLVGCNTACLADELKIELAKRGIPVGDVKGRDTYVKVDQEGHKLDATVDDPEALPKTLQQSESDANESGNTFNTTRRLDRNAPSRQARKPNPATIAKNKEGQWRDAQGRYATDPGWPSNDGFVDGKESVITLLPGTLIDRFGRSQGKFTAPTDTPFDNRALRDSVYNGEYHGYEVTVPIEGVRAGPAKPWFGKPGGGTQYRLPQSVDSYSLNGALIEINRPHKPEKVLARHAGEPAEATAASHGPDRYTQRGGLQQIPSGPVKVQLVGHGDPESGKLGGADPDKQADHVQAVTERLDADPQNVKLAVVGCNTACLTEPLKIELVQRGISVSKVKGRDTYVKVDAEGRKLDTTVNDLAALPKTRDSAAVNDNDRIPPLREAWVDTSVEPSAQESKLSLLQRSDRAKVESTAALKVDQEGHKGQAEVSDPGALGKPQGAESSEVSERYDVDRSEQEIRNKTFTLTESTQTQRLQDNEGYRSVHDLLFMNNPEQFLKSNVIVMDEHEQMAEGNVPGIRRFTLIPAQHNAMLLRFQQQGEGIDAYWLPWASHKATTLTLGDEADFFFTSHLTNCRFCVLARDPANPNVAHVAGDLNSSAQRDKAERDAGFGVGEDGDLVRRLSISDSRQKRPFGSKTVIPKKHSYSGQTGLPDSHSSAFVYGHRQSDGSWKFDAQVVKGRLTEGFMDQKLTNDLPILDHIDDISNNDSLSPN
ncbi:glycohydrolase toxin TNT-related protein, partial [Burkholderia ubonensis]|uniref:glycohydrolase toxin TNT-related protein n=1 Tax=Burkholderia ubonensis TaxID=101571 RepID=UPI000A48A046